MIFWGVVGWTLAAIGSVELCMTGSCHRLHGHPLPATHLPTHPPPLARLPRQISLLRVAPGGAVVSVADIVASVEPSGAGAGNVLFVRFYEGDGAAAVGLGGSQGRPSEQRLQVSFGCGLRCPAEGRECGCWVIALHRRWPRCMPDLAGGVST